MQKIIIYISILIATTFSVAGQSINTEFGKNRVQYHDDFNNWWQYETENFITYWYGKARFIAQPTIQLAEMDHDEIQNILEHRINDKIEIIVYVDVTDLKQSNIGTEETFINKTGETKIVGNKMFVYFDGNHQNLRSKIREGIATVYLNNMLYGSNLQEIIQNAVLLNIPDWYRQGVVSYAASNWNGFIEDEFRDIWERDKKNRDFTKLSNKYPRLAGHSFWFFIDQYYGKSSISNLLYLTKISRGMDNSFEYILNTDLPRLKEQWAKFYTQYYNVENKKFDEKPKKAEVKLANKKYAPISNIKLSPKGDQLLYVHNNQGKIKVVLRDLKTGEEKNILKYGYKNIFQETDYNYPIVAWHPTKPEVSIIYELKDIIKLVKYRIDMDEKLEQIIPTDFQRIYSLSYVDDLDYVFSGNIDGFSELFWYKSKNRNYERLTNDFYDDLDAEYVTYEGEKGILFSSNRVGDSVLVERLDTILPIGNFDLFFMTKDSKYAKRITSTNNINERYPYLFSTNKIAYLSDKSGVINTYAYDIGTKKSISLSNLDRNIIRHHAISGKNTYVTTYYKDGMYKFYMEELDPNINVPTYNTQAKEISTDQPKIEAIIPFLPEKELEQVMIPEQFLFQTEFQDPSFLEAIKSNGQPEVEGVPLSLSGKHNSGIIKPVEKYNNTRAVAANRKFGLNNVVTKLDNDLLFGGLESYTGDRQQLLNVPMGILLKASVQDLFEDYKIEGGVRIPTTFNGSEYFMVFDNKKGRIDKRIALYRKSNKYDNNITPNQAFPTKSKKTSLLGLYQMKYPFDIYRSVTATGSLRNDKFIQLSTETNSFNSPLESENRLSLKLEYIYDNTFDASVNIKNGTRYKIFVEAINQFDLEIIDGFKLNPSNGFTAIFGFDARHYIPLLGKSVLALRGSGATSLGSKKMLYYIGGIENSLFPKFDNTIPVPSGNDFAYKVNAFQMRGFDNNIRNGASFVLANAELRIPFMQYLFGANRGSTFFRNMQIVGFYDAGVAWHGLTPYSEENPLNKVTITSPPLIELQIEYFRDPLVMGYGIGFRTQLLGYFVKADRAWGVETRAIQPPKWYLSFGMDF